MKQEATLVKKIILVYKPGKIILLIGRESYISGEFIFGRDPNCTRIQHMTITLLYIVWTFCPSLLLCKNCSKSPHPTCPACVL